MESCQAYQKALNLDSNNPDRSHDLGRACVADKRFAEAAPLLEKAAKASPRNIALLHLLAECYLQLSDTESAEEIYRRINRLDPRDEGVKTKLKEMASVTS